MVSLRNVTISESKEEERCEKTYTSQVSLLERLQGMRLDCKHLKGARELVRSV